MSEPSRPVIAERRTYAPVSRQERFIVPLLKRAIDDYLSSASTRTHLELIRSQGRQPVVLDVGCGGQPLRDQLIAMDCEYLSMDAVQQPGVKLDFLGAIDSPMSPSLATFANTRGADLIVCTEVLEHVADWPSAWRNLALLLRPSGLLLITCPMVYPLHEEPYDFFRPTHHAIQHHARLAGLEVRKLDRLGSAREVWGTLLAAGTPDPASQGLTSKLLAVIARKARKLLFSLLMSDWLHARIVYRGPLYLSNLAVLAKPGQPSRAETIA